MILLKKNYSGMLDYSRLTECCRFMGWKDKMLTELGLDKRIYLSSMQEVDMLGITFISKPVIDGVHEIEYIIIDENFDFKSLRYPDSKVIALLRDIKINSIID